VYTCITDDYDLLVPPVYTSDEIRYICFTTRPDVQVSGWELRPIDVSLSGYPPSLINRRYKFFPWDFLPQHEWSLYVDGNVRILNDPRPLIGNSKASGIQLLAPAHTDRTTIREELQACIYWGKIRGTAIPIAEERLSYYDSDGFVDTNRLTENNILFRPGDPGDVRPAMEMWWDELKYFAGRDQISLPYVIWKSGLSLRVLGATSRLPDKYFAAVNHRKDTTSLVGYVDARRHHSRAWAVANFAVSKPRNLIRRFQRAGIRRPEKPGQP
jgi:hypothetical protein